MIQRQLNLASLLDRKSHFLFGPRGTGKSYLITQDLRHRALVVDLLASETLFRLSADPSELEALAAASGKPWVVIDEIQKLPILLDEVHRLIERARLRFLLTGSSARKLRRGQANLLAGRARTAWLFPLCWAELSRSKQGFDLDRMLLYGGLPPVYLSDEPGEELRAYVGTYLKEEIRAEGLIRRLPQFSRFLLTAALSNGQILNFTQIGSDAGVSPSTVREYYAVLEDTLVGFQLPPWRESRLRKAVATAKFYFFDTGVAHALAGTRALDRNSDLYGRSFEHWLAMELRAYLGYARRDDALGFWRSKHGAEVDFVIGDHTAVEAKASRRVSERDLKGLVALAEERVFKNLLLVSADPTEARRSGVRCLPWRRFMEDLWDGALLSG